MKPIGWLYIGGFILALLIVNFLLHAFAHALLDAMSEASIHLNILSWG